MYAVAVFQRRRLKNSPYAGAICIRGGIFNEKKKKADTARAAKAVR